MYVLIVLEVDKYKIKVPASSFLGEVSSWLADGCLLTISSHGKETVLASYSSCEDTNSIIRSLPHDLL